MPQKIYFRWRQQEAVAIVVDVQIGQIWRMLMVNDDSSFWGALSSLLMKLCGPVLYFLCETSLFQASFIDCSGGGSFLTMLQLQIFWPWTTVESGLSACTPRKAPRRGRRRRWPFANWRLWLKRTWFRIYWFLMIWIYISQRCFALVGIFNFFILESVRLSSWSVRRSRSVFGVNVDVKHAADRVDEFLSVFFIWFLIGYWNNLFKITPNRTLPRHGYILPPLQAAAVAALARHSLFSSLIKPNFSR